MTASPARGTRAAGLSWALVVGAALHWASLLYLGFGTEGALSAAGPADAVDGLISWVHTPLTALIALVAIALPHLFERERPRLGLAIASILAGLGTLGTIGVAHAREAAGFDLPLLLAFELCLAVNISLMVLLWGFAFASLDKRTAGRHAVLTALLSLALALLLHLVSPLAIGGGTALGVVARILSASVLLGRRVRFVNTRRPLSKQAPVRAAIARFYSSRVVLGLAIGAAYWAAVRAEPSESFSPLLIGAGLVVCIALLAVFLHMGDELYGFLPIMPLVLVGCLFAPYARGGATMLVPLAPTVLWLSWIFASSFQLSGLKETFGMSETTLSFSEKAALMVGWSAGIALGPLVVPTLGAEPLGLVATYGAVLWATFASFRTVYNRREDAFIAQLESERAEQDARTYDEICRRFGLTPREREVMVMLAQGYTRPHICQELSISDGTARAHAFHVYQKIGVHKKDDLLKLVREIGESAPR
ncbi:MAG: helix-turn-helix transcriptional regulator [Coriobacteriia bacterium]|nr:helix-turn-helix transcriptional regulator [Coriobacteriia bacterium]